MFLHKKISSNKFSLKEKRFPLLINKKRLTLKSIPNLSFFYLRILSQYIKNHFNLYIKKTLYSRILYGIKSIPKFIINKSNDPIINKKNKVRRKKMINFFHKLRLSSHGVFFNAFSSVFKRVRKKALLKEPFYNHRKTFLNYSIFYNYFNPKSVNYSSFNFKTVKDNTSNNDLIFKKTSKKKRYRSKHNIKILNSYMNYIFVKKRCLFLGLFYYDNLTYSFLKRRSFFIN